MKENDLELKLLSGSSIEIDSIGLLHPLTLKEISIIGENKYNQFLAVLTHKHESLTIEDEVLTPFQVMLIYCYRDIEYRKLLIQSLNSVFKEEIHFHKDGFFYLGDLEEERIITEQKHIEAIDIIKKQNFFKEEKEEDEFNPHDDKARELIEKIKKFRQMIKEQNAEDGLNLGDIISIVASYSANISMFNVWDLTVYQLYTLYIRLMMKDNYESQFQFMLQGAEIKPSDLKHWSAKLNK